MNKSMMLPALVVLSWCAIASPLSAGKVLTLARKMPTVVKSAERADKVIDVSKAISKGKKIYRAVDLADDGVRLGKGMLGKFIDAVGDDIVEQCAKHVKTAQAGNLDEVGKILARSVNKAGMTQAERDLILNDAYLRIAEKAGKISAEEADDAFRLLKKTDGLHTTVRKLCSANAQQTAGHLYEFRQAIAFQKKGFEVLGLGVKYSDGLKSNLTDLDILVRRGRKLFLVESKHYTHGVGSPDVIRADAESLIALKNHLSSELGASFEIKPIFSFVTEPAPLLAKQLENKGIPYVCGEGDELVELLSAIY